MTFQPLHQEQKLAGRLHEEVWQPSPFAQTLVHAVQAAARMNHRALGRDRGVQEFLCDLHDTGDKRSRLPCFCTKFGSFHFPTFLCPQHCRDQFRKAVLGIIGLVVSRDLLENESTLVMARTSRQNKLLQVVKQRPNKVTGDSQVHTVKEIQLAVL